jgi:hypothetical protein
LATVDVDTGVVTLVLIVVCAIAGMLANRIGVRQVVASKWRIISSGQLMCSEKEAPLTLS